MAIRYPITYRILTWSASGNCSLDESMIESSSENHLGMLVEQFFIAAQMKHLNFLSSEKRSMSRSLLAIADLGTSPPCLSAFLMQIKSTHSGMPADFRLCCGNGWDVRHRIPIAKNLRRDILKTFYIIINTFIKVAQDFENEAPESHFWILINLKG